MVENAVKKNIPVKSSSEKKDKKKPSTFRLLPVVIFFCSLMLTIRLGVVWRMFTETKTPEIFSVSKLAAEPEEKKDEKKEDKKTEKKDSKNDKDSKVSLSAKSEGPNTQEPGKSFSQFELEILQNLAKRREELDVREREIEQKIGVIKAAEAQIEGKIAKLNELKDTISELVGLYNEKEKNKINNLVKIYSSMKPKEAARLFDQMEMEQLLPVFENMKEAKAAPVLALMDSQKAIALTKELSTRKLVPATPEELNLMNEKNKKDNKNNDKK
ncbi:MAG: hypothetical protein MJ247_07765 [Alphaproteobacteria bacterium]|nr:hypothetical protein [Alphaproteobacteria bacterium]